MNIDEAIDKNKKLKEELVREGRLEEAEAVQLGTEALKHILFIWRRWRKQRRVN